MEFQNDGVAPDPQQIKKKSNKSGFKGFQELCVQACVIYSLLGYCPLLFWYMALWHRAEMSVIQCSCWTCAFQVSMAATFAMVVTSIATPWQWHVALMPAEIL